MARREDQWTAMSLEYRDGHWGHSAATKALTVVCLVFRDGSWAAGLYPYCSMGTLGVSTAATYIEARKVRAVWLGYDANGPREARFQETFGSPGHGTPLSDWREPTLMKLAGWVRGGPFDAG